MAITQHIVMAFDFGIKNIGVAIGQFITHTAQPLISLKSKHGIPDWKNIKKIFDIWKPTIIIVGLPINMDGTEQKITVQARNFANHLDFFLKKKVILYDERLSTFEANNKLLFYNKNYYIKKYQIDAESAAIILESWLNKINLIFQNKNN